MLEEPAETVAVAVEGTGVDVEMGAASSETSSEGSVGGAESF